MTFPERLTEAFKELEKEHQFEPMSIDIQPSGGGRFVAILMSPAFEEVPDYARQDLAWGKVLETFDDSDQRLVEFIHTPAPSEEAGEEEAPVTAAPKRRKRPATRA